MRPAFSVILFTVLSGAGLGALAWTALLTLALPLMAGSALASGDAVRATLAGLGLVVVGLSFSTLHLANPRNAWRSMARWRSSWLSREAVLALVLLPVAAASAIAWWRDLASVRVPLALMLVVLATAMLFATAMIYASLKPIRQWHTARVPIGYLLLGYASGGLVALACMPGLATQVPGIAETLAVLLLVAAAAKVEYWIFVRGASGSVTIERAIGVAQGVRPPLPAAQPGSAKKPGATGPGSVMGARLLDAGHSRGTFLTHEFMADAGTTRAWVLKALALGAGFVLPATLILAADATGRAVSVAPVACMIGFIAERWLFFAEARHTVRLYHGDKRT